MPVIKNVSYCLVHTPDILYHCGSTQVTERIKNPTSDYLIKLKQHLRSYEDALGYIPNQAYIGNIRLNELKNLPRPWYTAPGTISNRYGSYGEIMPEGEFYGLMKICDAFDLVVLEETFLAEIKICLTENKLITAAMLAKLSGARPLSDIEKMVSAHTAEGLFLGERLIGCVRQAHEIDVNLNAHIILENLAAKASGVLAAVHLIHNAAIDASEVDYVIECSEEACGDMNQRGGGNFAKAIGEIAGFSNATGSDVRGFCAGPAHALLQAASLVKAGVFNHVVVVGGGAVAKLGMNAKDHVAKNMPALEDMLGAFAVLVAKDDGVNPIIRLDVIGKHTIASGAAPQQVMKALVGDPLVKLGKKITEIDYYAVEMQNPELTEPAGAGNVPESNYKMIGALAAMSGEIARTDLPAFISKHGLPGFAPTQGHIPSGVPLLGFFREQILSGQMQTGMIIGKGSLFLARMTNLFDGLSLIIEKNPGLTAQQPTLTKEAIRELIAEALLDMAVKLGQRG